MTHSFRLACLAFTVATALLSTHSGFAQDGSPVDFTRDVRPILSDRCFRCHGPDEAVREAELRLDQQQGLFENRDGHVSVQPNSPEDSELIRRILSDDPDEVMPPPDSNRQLTPQQKEILVRWVKQGAQWEQHWSLILPTMPELPTPENINWCRNEIDRFILARQEAAGLRPSPEAPPHMLVRRLYLDLTGLPPTTANAKQWIAKIWGENDNAEVRQANEVAYQELVEHLLQSPHYGERWTRRWLDLARYADTNGYEKDRDRSIWPYRDWVVNAINSGMPFDRFTIEQLAGDMLPNATIDQRIATGFHRNTMLNEEGGIDPLEFRYHAMTDRVATTGTTWLGLTLGCCQCHTHKYDPVSHREYYQVMAFLNNADEPSLKLPDESLDAQWVANRSKAEQLLKELPAKWPVDLQDVVETKVVNAKGEPDQKLEPRDDGTIIVSGANPETATYVVELQIPAESFDSLRLTTGTPEKHAGPGRTAHGNFVLSEIEVEAIVGDGDVIRLPIASAAADVEQPMFDISKAFDGDDTTGWAIHSGGSVPKTATASFRIDRSSLKEFPEKPLRLKVTLKQLYGTKHTIAAFQLQAIRQHAEPVDKLRQQRLNEAFAKWRQDELPNAANWTPLQTTEATSSLPLLTILDDHSIFASGDTAKRDDYFITLAAADTPVTALRLEALPDERLPAGGPGSTYYEGTPGDFYLTEIHATSGEQEFPFSAASETFAKNRFGSNPASAELAIDGDVQTGWAVHGRQAERHVAVFLFKDPVPAGTPLKIHMTFGRHFASSLGRFRFSATNATTAPKARTYSADVAALLNNSDRQLSDTERKPLLDVFLLHAPQLAAETEKIRNLQKRPESKTTLVMAERPATNPRPTHRHHRGEYLQPKEVVQPGLPGVLLQSDGSTPRNRLQFAQWLVSKENPLTARVVVNRQWANIFGTGIVRTVDDFGLQGETPSHPELLDWLAVTFMQDDAWSLKELHCRIVSSATYRQTSVVAAEAPGGNPENRLLTHSPRYRLDAEAIRDQLLIAAGVLSDKRGGPPVRPLQPRGVTEAAYGSPKWTASSGDERYRRSLYTFMKRTAPFAMFSTFDAPSGEACIAQRNRSNSPLQALTLLNDVMLMDLSRHAGRLFAERPETAAENISSLNELFQRVLVRPPTAEEVAALRQFHQTQYAMFLADPKSAAKFLELSDAASRDMSAEKTARIAAWSAVARAIFGLDEALTRE